MSFHFLLPTFYSLLFYTQIHCRCNYFVMLFSIIINCILQYLSPQKKQKQRALIHAPLFFYLRVFCFLFCPFGAACSGLSRVSSVSGHLGFSYKTTPAIIIRYHYSLFIYIILVLISNFQQLIILCQIIQSIKPPEDSL